MSRPIEFDRQTALRKAMTLFWRNGYASSSLSELVKVMGISRSSLYHTFRSKERLFAEALDLYCNEQMAILRTPAPQANERSLLRSYFAGQSTGAPSGCFFVSSLAHLEAFPLSIRQQLRKQALEQETLIIQLLKRARSNGRLKSSLSLASIARFLICFNYGHILLGKAAVGKSSKNSRAATFHPEKSIEEILAFFF